MSEFSHLKIKSFQSFHNRFLADSLVKFVPLGLTPDFSSVGYTRNYNFLFESGKFSQRLRNENSSLLVRLDINRAVELAIKYR